MQWKLQLHTKLLSPKTMARLCVLTTQTGNRVSKEHSCRRQTSQCSLDSAPFSYSHRDKRHAVFIKIVCNRRGDGVECFNPYTGLSAEAVPSLWITSKSQTWSYFCVDVPWIMWSLCAGAPTNSSFHPALYRGIVWALWSKCAPLKAGDSSGLLNFSKIKLLHPSTVLKYYQNQWSKRRLVRSVFEVRFISEVWHLRRGVCGCVCER